MKAAGSASALRKALDAWERVARQQRVAAQSLDSSRAALVRVREDVGLARCAVLADAAEQGRAEAWRKAHNGKQYQAKLRELAWLQAREAEREREEALLAAFVDAIRERVAKASECVRAADYAGAPVCLTLAQYRAQAAAAEVPL